VRSTAPRMYTHCARHYGQRPYRVLYTLGLANQRLASVSWNATWASQLGEVTTSIQAISAWHNIQSMAEMEPSILDGAAGEENMGDKRPFWMARLTKEEGWKMNGGMGTSPLWAALARGWQNITTVGPLWVKPKREHSLAQGGRKKFYKCRSQTSTRIWLLPPECVGHPGAHSGTLRLSGGGARLAKFSGKAPMVRILLRRF
jgi:hypothetical protein